jgi:hypothetical protein
LQSADLSVFDHFFEPDYRGMVVQDVADEERFLFLRGQAYQFFAVGLIEGKGLFDKDVFARVEGFFCDFVVEGGRGGDDDTGDCGIFEDIGEVRGDHSFTPTLPSPIKGDGRRRFPLTCRHVRFLPSPIEGEGVRWVGFRHLFAYGLGAIADGLEDAKLVEVADEVLAPVAGTENGNRTFNVQRSMFYVRGRKFNVQGSRFKVQGSSSYEEKFYV